MREDKARQRIFQLMDQRGMTLYQLAKTSKIPLTTLYNLQGKKTVNPSNATIEKICRGLDITLPEFYNYEDYDMWLTDEERRLIEIERGLNERDRKRLMGYAEGLSKN